MQFGISLLTNDSGALKATQYLSINDIKVGIPALLLCIEMAIFAVMHIFAFPWRATYKLPKDGITTADVLNAPGAGFSGQPEYHGGPFGIKAYADAFNPWDIIKAIGRGFRWLFVGVKHRRNDSSYAFTGPLGTGMEQQEDIKSTKLQPLAPDYNNTGYDPFADHQILKPYPAKPSPYRARGRDADETNDDDDDPWNPNLRPSRSPSPMRTLDGATAYTPYKPPGKSPYLRQDDHASRGLLHQPPDPFNDDNDDDDDIQPHPAGGRHVRKISSTALEKQDQAGRSPDEMHPAYRPGDTGRDVEEEDARARGPGRGGWV